LPGASKPRWYGSMRIRRDGRIGFSPWSYADLPHVAVKVLTDLQITVVSAGLPVMFLYPKRNRILTACFVADLTADQLRRAVAELRHARDGLDMWIVPALEWSLAQADVRAKHADTFAIIPELLESCRDLPVAEHWQRIRANVFANAAETVPIKEKAGPLGKESTPWDGPESCQGQERTTQGEQGAGASQDKKRRGTRDTTDQNQQNHKPTDRQLPTNTSKANKTGKAARRV